MAADPLHAQFPSGPLTDEAGNLTPVWRGYFMQLFARTGGPAPSTSLPALDAGLAAETDARTKADQDLDDAITAESTARKNADATEAAARIAADDAEAVARAAADNTRLPLAGGTLTGAVRGPLAVMETFQAGIAAGSPTWTSGNGAPASAAPLGSLYSRKDGTVGATIYISRGGGTWNAVAGV